MLTRKAIDACREHGVADLQIGGGVAANSRLRALAAARCESAGIRLRIPRPGLCTDNGAMVAALGAAGGRPRAAGLAAGPRRGLLAARGRGAGVTATQAPPSAPAPVARRSGRCRRSPPTAWPTSSTGWSSCSCWARRSPPSCGRRRGSWPSASSRGSSACSGRPSAWAWGSCAGQRPDGTDRPPPGWLGVITTAGCLISLEVLRVGAGLSGPWPARAPRGGPVRRVRDGRGPAPWPVGSRRSSWASWCWSCPSRMRPGTATRSCAPPWRRRCRRSPWSRPGSPSPWRLGALGRAARGLQRNLDVRYEVLVREQAVREAAQVAAEVERSLHDTALNTLETISAHGDHLDPEVVAERCRADHAQLSVWRQQADLSDLSDVMERLEAHAQRLGLDARVGPGDRSGSRTGRAPGARPSGRARPRSWPPWPRAGRGGPDQRGQARRASRGRRCSCVMTALGCRCSSPTRASAREGAADGFGVSRSIRERMESVGGEALTGPGPEGRGTVVLLEWRRKPPVGSGAGLGPPAGNGAHRAHGRHVPRGDGQRPDRPRMARVLPAVAGPGRCRRPGDRRGGRRRAGAQRATGSAPARSLAACATYVLVGAVALLADPYCASLLGEGVMLDARAPMMAVILLLAPRPGCPGGDRRHGRGGPPRGGPGVVRPMGPVRPGHRGGRGLRGGRPGRLVALRRSASTG